MSTVFRKRMKKSLAVFLATAVAVPMTPVSTVRAVENVLSDYAGTISNYERNTVSELAQTDEVTSYDFASGSGFQSLSNYNKTNPISSISSTDGLVTLNGTGTMYWNDATHGLALKGSNSISIEVQGSAYITVKLCSFSKDGVVAVSGGAISSTSAPSQHSLAGSSDGETVQFAYSGDAATLELLFNNNSTAYIHGITVTNTTADVDTKFWGKKDFSISINGQDVEVTGAPSQADTASIQLSNGKVYYGQSEKAYISMNLNGNSINQKLLQNNSPSVVDTLAVDKNGDIVVTFVDQTTYPSSYTIKVQDTSQYEIPGVTSIYSFELNGNAIPNEFTKANGIEDYYTTNNGILSIGTGTGLNHPYFHDTTHGIALNNGNYIDVKVAGDASISFSLCGYSNAATVSVENLAQGGLGSFIDEKNDFKGSVCTDTITYTYSGDATTLRFVLNGSGESYLHALTVKNTGTVAGSTVANPQSSMPSEFGATSNFTITPTGHRLNFNHSDEAASIATLSDTGYYLFDAVTEFNTIEADIKITSIGSTSSNGLLFGIFEDAEPITKAATIALRGDGSVRNYYTKTTGTSLGAGGINTKFSINEVMHLKLTKTSNGIDATFTSDTGAGSYTVKYSNMNSYFTEDANVKFGLALANVSGTITNLIYTEADGNVLYDQNDCYDAVGDAPIATEVDDLLLSDDRTKISVTWSGENCADDGTYMVEVSKDGGITFETLSTAVTTRSYEFDVTGDGSYVVRVSGLCGNKTSSAVTSGILLVQAPLNTPTIGADSFDSAITLSWNAIDQAKSYCVYRRSTEESDYIQIADVQELAYTDKNVVNETPYYYYVIAKSESNESNPSNIILTLPSAGHVGEYEYGDQAANIAITKKSYDTVYKNQATLEGVVDKAGTIQLEVNEIIQNQVALEAKGTFSFVAELEEGRNDVNLYFTDRNGIITRKTYNFVYLTNYDVIVDAAYTGADGEEDENTPGVKVYKTVQAAVDSVSTSNTSRVVILIKEGNYDEHLVVNSPYITLVGEDRDKVNINFFDAVESPVGGDTSLRCAVYIKSGATGFSAENLTFENTYAYLGDGTISNESADALRVDADESTFINVKLLGYQDTLNASSKNQYYEKCYITGNVDFIYGSAQALFNDCDLVFRYSATKNSGYVTAPKTDAAKDYGYIFNSCRILAESGCNGNKYLLARPWGPDGAATFINSYMSGIVNATQPYSDMSGNLATEARFQEYYTYGAGFKINNNRPQISKAQADEMLTVSSLGWNPETVSNQISVNNYVGTIVTTGEEKFVETEYVDDTFDPSSTDDTGLGNFGLSGYASAQGVTGGGYLLETSDDYYKVATAEEFLAALTAAKTNGKASVIELTADIALGSIELGSSLSTYSTVIKANSNQPLLHPTLLKTGVSTLSLSGMSNLTIFSQNGAKITHTCVDINGSSNIIIRNIVFDELWEWDEFTNGDYDRNDWDYVTIQNGSTGIWIDHCTFYKAYDGVVDIKKALADVTTDVTISWCKFLPESEGTFFDDMMDLLESNSDKYTYYNTLLNKHSMTKEQVRAYASFQKKTHLVGASDTEANMENLRLTLANNYYKNSMDRMPRLRAGSAHVFNCILDAADIYELKNSLTDDYAIKKIVSNGAISTCGASVLLENCYINGIMKALISGNGNSAGGYINAVDSVYYMDGVKTELKPINNVEGGNPDDALILDRDAFVANLPYSDYVLRNAENLSQTMVPYAGAGTVDMSNKQWMKTRYNEAPVTDEPGSGDEDINTPDDGSDDSNQNGGNNDNQNGGSDNSQNSGSINNQNSSDSTVAEAKAESISKEESAKIEAILAKDKNNDSAVSVKITGGTKGNITVKIDVSSEKDLRAGDKVYVYRLNANREKLYSIYGGYGYKVSADGKILLTVADEGTYIVMKNPASNNVIKSLPGQTWVSVDYPVLYLNGEVGAKRQLVLHLPKCLEVEESLTNKTTGQAVGPVTVTYTSSDETVATVSEDGVITAKGSGMASIRIQITYTSGKVKTVTKKITVKNPFIRIKKVKSEMKVNEISSIIAQGYGVPTKKLEYEVENPSVLSIDEKGNVSALKAGTTTVTVKYGNIENKQVITVK